MSNKYKKILTLDIIKSKYLDALCATRQYLSYNSIVQQLKKPELICCIVMILANLSFCYWIDSKTKKIFKDRLSFYSDAITNLLTNDIKTILLPLDSQKDLYLLKKIELLNQDDDNVSLHSSIKVNSYALEVKFENKKYKIDLQQFKEMVSGLIPSSILYQIIINDHNIAIRYGDGIYSVVLSRNVGSDIGLKTQMSINSASAYYKHNIRTAQRGKIIFIMFTLTIYLITYFASSKKSKKLEEDKELLEIELFEQEKIIDSFIKHNKVNDYLSELFVKKSTEIYIKQASMSNNEDLDFNESIQSSYLFPMRLTDLTSETIEVKELVENLQSYFSIYYQDTSIQINSEVSTIKLNCAKEVFYQIIFSLIFNLKELVHQQDSLPKFMTVTFNQQKVSIIFDGFLLDKEKLIHISKHILPEYLDVFMLNFDKIFKSLEEHNIDYTIKQIHDENYIELFLEKSSEELEATNKPKSATGKIINFTDYTK